MQRTPAQRRPRQLYDHGDAAWGRAAHLACTRLGLAHDAELIVDEREHAPLGLLRLLLEGRAPEEVDTQRSRHRLGIGVRELQAGAAIAAGELRLRLGRLGVGVLRELGQKHGGHRVAHLVAFDGAAVAGATRSFPHGGGGRSDARGRVGAISPEHRRLLRLQPGLELGLLALGVQTVGLELRAQFGDLHLGAGQLWFVQSTYRSGAEFSPCRRLEMLEAALLSTPLHLSAAPYYSRINTSSYTLTSRSLF